MVVLYFINTFSNPSEADGRVAQGRLTPLSRLLLLRFLRLEQLLLGQCKRGATAGPPTVLSCLSLSPFRFAAS